MLINNKNEKQKINALKGKVDNKEYIRIWAHKNSVEGESEKAILVKFKGNDNTGGNDFKIWFDKRFVFTSEYSNRITISLNPNDDFKYNIYLPHSSNWKNPDSVISGKELQALLSINSPK